MATRTPITVAHGDGIGPEIMAATLHILEAAGALLDIETIEAGEKVYLSGNTSGILPSARDSLRRTKVFLKAPFTTPHVDVYIEGQLKKAPELAALRNYNGEPGFMLVQGQ
jgi:isocitrate/isopropylmalate dehydrogenase